MAFADLVAAADVAIREHLGGVTVTYQPEVGDAVAVGGMFDAQYRLIDPVNAGVEQTVPAVFLRLADLPADPDDDEPQLTIDGVTYSVRERQPDGLGGIRFLLHRTT